MLKSVLFVLAFFAAYLVSDNASARLVKVSWISESELKTKCAENGGTWNSSDSGYSCGKRCAGNDYCVYGCSKGREVNSCNASIPLVRPQSGVQLGGAAAVNKVLNWTAPADVKRLPGANVQRPAVQAR